MGQWVKLKGHFRTKSESDFSFLAEAGCCPGCCKENWCVDWGLDWVDWDSFHSVSLLGRAELSVRWRAEGRDSEWVTLLGPEAA